jgi:hypothetical protein
MTMLRCAPVVALSLAACGGAPPAAPAAAGEPREVAEAEPVASALSPACASPEHRQLDFWLGTWDLVVKAPAAPGEPWAEAPGVQRIERILGGCAIAEHFTADGPGAPWAGASYSVWVAPLGTWRQTWVDDQGSYLAFTGGVEDGVMRLYGEPRDKDGQRIQMRMTFEDVTADALRWEWQRQVDGGAWEAQMVIEYRRRAE